jgi:aryl-alcohol dehydrogenase-like predicted oxidoreductase
LLYNLVKRQAEVELLPLGRDEGLGVIVFNSLGGGLLSGKYTTSEKPRAGRLTEDTLYMSRYREPVYYGIAERVKNYAAKRGIIPARLSIAWVMSHPAVTAPIVGARNLERLEAWFAAAELNMTQEWRSDFSSLSIQPPPDSDRLEEQPQEKV